MLRWLSNFSWLAAFWDLFPEALHFGRRNLIKVKLKAKLQKGKIP